MYENLDFYIFVYSTIKHGSLLDYFTLSRDFSSSACLALSSALASSVAILCNCCSSFLIVPSLSFKACISPSISASLACRACSRDAICA